MSDVPIQIVDEHDQPIGQATMQEAWEKGLIHRIVHVMAVNDKDEVLLQKRSPTQELFPDCWDNSAAGHVDFGESYAEAAKRETQEEIGLKTVELEEIGSYIDFAWEGKQLKRFTKVYRILLNKLPQNLGKDEVTAVRWFTIDDMKRLVADYPEQCSDGLMQVVERYY